MDLQDPNMTSPYDIFVVAGQSNALSGTGDGRLLPLHPKIDQVLRDRNNLYEIDNLQIGPATEPLHHFSVTQNSIGFPLQFAILYSELLLGRKGRKVLLVPCSASGKGFSTKPSWKPNDVLFNDVVQRIAYVHNRYPESRLCGVLWQQGEADAMSAHTAIKYSGELEILFRAFRDKLPYDREMLPIIMSGMTAHGVRSSSEYGSVVQSAIENIRHKLPMIAYVDVDDLSSNDDELNNGDLNHFSAIAHHELAKRYFDAYLSLKADELFNLISDGSKIKLRSE